MPRTGFDPRAHGLHFGNDFVDKVVTVPGYGEVATDGRSGGMAFAAPAGGVDNDGHLNRPWATLPHRGTRTRGRGVKAAPGVRAARGVEAVRGVKAGALGSGGPGGRGGP